MSAFVYWLTIGINVGGAIMNLRLMFQLRREYKKLDIEIEHVIALRKEALADLLALHRGEEPEITIQ